MSGSPGVPARGWASESSDRSAPEWRDRSAPAPDSGLAERSSPATDPDAAPTAGPAAADSEPEPAAADPGSAPRPPPASPEPEPGSAAAEPESEPGSAPDPEPGSAATEPGSAPEPEPDHRTRIRGRRARVWRTRTRARPRTRGRRARVWRTRARARPRTGLGSCRHRGSQPAPRVDIQILRPAIRADLGGLEGGGRRQPGQRTTQHLAPFGKPGADQAEQQLGINPGRIDRRHGPPANRHQGRFHLGPGHEDGGRDVGDHARFGPVGHLDRYRSVLTVPRQRNQPIGDLSLHHDHQAFHDGNVIEEGGDQRGGDVVGQVGDHDPAGIRPQEVRPVQAKRIPLHHLDRQGPQHRLEHRDQPGVDLYCSHAGPGVGERDRERAEAGSDLDHPVAGPGLRQAHDAPHGVGIDHEVLAQGPARPQTVRRQQVADLAGRQGHEPAPAPSTGRRNTAAVLVQVASSTTCAATPRVSATAAPTTGTSAGRFGRPR